MSRSIGCTLFDEHASVLTHWFASGVRDRTLICFDAHLDLQRISCSRLERLKACGHSGELAQWMKPHHWYPDRNAVSNSVYSFSIEDFLYAAKQLGIINRLVWVAPPHIPIFDPVGAIEQLRQSDGVDLETLSSLQLVSDPANSAYWIEGVLYDLPMVICREECLVSLDLPVNAIVDFDIDYFVELPSERIGRLPQETVRRVLELDLDFDEITISRSVLSGYTPAGFAWIGESIAEAFAQGSSTEQVRDATRHDFPLSVPENVNEFLRRLSRYGARGIRPTRDEFELLSLWSEAYANVPECEQAGLVAAGLGLVHLFIGDSVGAKEYYRKAAVVFGEHPELALEIAKDALGKGDLVEADAYFTKATLDDKSRASAQHHLGVIGILQFQESRNASSLQDAIRHLDLARGSAPAWSENLSLLSQACALAGDESASGTFREEFLEINQVCQHFIQQFEHVKDE